MAFKFCSLLLAVALLGNFANGASRPKRGGITVISGVDQNGKEYGQVYRYSDEGKSDLVNRFGDEDADIPEGPIGIPNIPDFYFPPIPQIPQLPPLNPTLDYNYFLNNYINLFSGMLRKPQFGGGNYAHASSSINFNNDFNGDFKNDFDTNFDDKFSRAYQDNLDVYRKTNEVALNAANQLSSKAGLNFEYQPWPEPDFASASAFVNPHDTEIKTSINNPNSGFLNSRFGFDSIDWNPIKINFDRPFGSLFQNGNGGPYQTINSNNKENRPHRPNNIDNRFANDDEPNSGSVNYQQTVVSSNSNGSPPRTVQTVSTSHSNDGRPVESLQTAIINHQNKPGNIDNRFSNDPENHSRPGNRKPIENNPQQGNYHSVQTISTSHSNGGRPVEFHQTTINNNNDNKPGNIDNRFSSEPENESRPSLSNPVDNGPNQGNYQSVQVVSTSHSNGGRPVETHQTTLINNNDKPSHNNKVDNRFSTERDNEPRPGYSNRDENRSVQTSSSSHLNGRRPIEAHETTLINSKENKHYPPNIIDNRFSTESENENNPERFSPQQTFVNSNVNSFPNGRFQNAHFPYGNSNLNDVVPQSQGNLQTVQTFVSTNGKPGDFKTTVYTNKNQKEPELGSRFSDDNDDKPNVQSSFVSSVHTNVNGKDNFRAEQVTNNKGSIRKVVTESV